MAIVRRSLRDGSGLTPEEEEAARRSVREAAGLPYAYDPDCPLLTEEQLKEFHPANFATWEERAEAMRQKAAERVPTAAEEKAADLAMTR